MPADSVNTGSLLKPPSSATARARSSRPVLASEAQLPTGRHRRHLSTHRSTGGARDSGARWCCRQEPMENGTGRPASATREVIKPALATDQAFQLFFDWFGKDS